MNKKYQCAILAGGLATRLRPITSKIPKSMVSVENKPFLEYQIELLKGSGVDEVVLCIGYKGDLIKGYFGNGNKFGIKITYSSEENLLGTGGALYKAKDLLREDFFVMYGDAYLEVDYLKIFDYYKKMECSALLTIYKNEDKFDTSNVSLIDDKYAFYDKQNPSHDMKFIDYGLSILSKKVIEKRIPENTFYDLADCYHSLSKDRELFGYEVKNRFYEMGTKPSLEEFREYIKCKNRLGNGH